MKRRYWGIAAGLVLAVAMTPCPAPIFADQIGETGLELGRAGSAVKTSTVEEFLTAVASDSIGTIELSNDLDLSDCGVIDISGKSVDLAGHTIYGRPFMTFIFEGSDCSIKNGSIESTEDSEGKKATYPLYIGDEGTTERFLLENVRVTSGGINIYNASVVLRNVEATGWGFYAVWCDSGSQVVIDGGRYGVAPNAKAVLGLSSKDTKMEIKNGTFLVASSAGEKPLVLQGDFNKPVITGGTFDTDEAKDYTGEGYALLVDEDGKATVMAEADAEAKAGAAVEKDGKKVYYTTEKAAENNNPSTGDQKPEIEVFVAEVGRKKFSTMEEAIAAAKNGGTVTLLRDLDGDAFNGKKYINITEAGTDVTIDLAGHKISLNNADTVSVSATDVTLVVKNGIIVNTHKDSYGLYTYATNDNIDVTFENLTLRTVDQAIGVQGQNSNQNVTLKDCDIKCETTAVYWPPKSGTLIIDGTRIEAKSGVTVKGGSVVVKGDTVITATGDKVVPDDYYDGSPDKKLVSTGSAIYVESGYNDRDIVLDIQSGTFESKNGVTVLYYAKEGEETEANRDIVISGGTFVGEPPADEFIVPGSGLNKNPDGSFGVHKHMLVEVAEVPATCDKDGAKAHWKCEVCGDLYLDEGMKTPVTDPNTLVLAKLGHKATHVPAKPATVDAEGVVEHWYCAACNTYFADAKLTKTMTKAETILAKLPKEFTVTFESGAGKPVVVVVKDGALLEEPAAPTLKGWKFLGWFKVKNADGTVAEKWDFAKDAVTADITLYGGWVKDEPAKPAAKPTNKLPKTGDASMLPMIVAGISGVAALAAASKRRKH